MRSGGAPLRTDSSHCAASTAFISRRRSSGGIAPAPPAAGIDSRIAARASPSGNASVATSSASTDGAAPARSFACGAADCAPVGAATTGHGFSSCAGSSSAVSSSSAARATRSASAVSRASASGFAIEARRNGSIEADPSASRRRTARPASDCESGRSRAPRPFAARSISASVRPMSRLMRAPNTAGALSAHGRPAPERSR